MYKSYLKLNESLRCLPFGPLSDVLGSLPYVHLWVDLEKPDLETSFYDNVHAVSVS